MQRITYGDFQHGIDIKWAIVNLRSLRSMDSVAAAVNIVDPTSTTDGDSIKP